MTTTELLAIFRSEVADEEAPYLWADALIYSYIDDAQKQFCRLTWGIPDAQNFTITLVAATEWYAIDAEIMEILGAYGSDGRSIPVMVRGENRARNVVFDGRTGYPQAFFKGMEKGYLRAYPIPITTGTVNLETRRLPATVSSGSSFEIDAQYQLGLVAWVKHKAYSKQDSETADPALAKRYEDEFNAYCARSKTEIGRLNRKVAVVKFRQP